MHHKIVLYSAGILFFTSLAFFLAQIVYIDNHPYDDFPIFYDAVKQYLSTGQLYTRHLDYYFPADGIYKFPALYSSLLLPFVKNGISLEDSQTFFLYLHCSLYVFSGIILVFLFAPEKNRSLFCFCSGILVLNLYSLYENLRTLQLEIYILFFVTLLLFLLKKHRYFLSGITLSIMAFLKVYPVFFAIYFLWKRKAIFFLGVFLASLLLILLMIACFGWEENRWYFFEVLPVILQEKVFINYENVGLVKLINHLFATSQFIHYETPLGDGNTAIAKVLLWASYLLALLAFFRKKTTLGSKDKYPHYVAFSLLITLVLLTLKNPWSNYQVLLVVPLLYILAALFSLLEKKFIGVLFFITCLLLFISPEPISVDSRFFSETGNSELMYVLRFLNSKLFAMRGMATVLVYIMLILLLYKKEKPAYE